MKTAKLSILCMMFLVLGVPQAALLDAAPQGKPFEFKDGRLSIEVDQAPLEEVLYRITGAAGVEIIVFDPIKSASVSLRIKDRPLEQALGSVLKGYSYSVVYNPDGERGGLRIVEQPRPSGPRHARIGTPAAAAAGAPQEGPLVVIAAEPLAAEQGESGPAGPSGEGAPASPSSGQQGSTGPAGPGTGGGGPGAGLESSPQESQEAAGASAREVPASGAQGDLAGAGSQRPGPEQRLKSLIARYEERVESDQSDSDYEMAVALSGGAHPVTHDLDRIEFWKEALKRHAGQ
jgi:hypothetical protein